MIDTSISILIWLLSYFLLKDLIYVAWEVTDFVCHVVYLYRTRKERKEVKESLEAGIESLEGKLLSQRRLLPSLKWYERDVMRIKIVEINMQLLNSKKALYTTYTL